VALNPSTPLAVLDYILDDIELVMLMAINPGIVGHKLIPRIMEKIKELKHKLTHHKHIQIQMDGGVTPETAAAMIKNGADILVCGSATIFKPHQPRDEKIKELRSSITMQISQDL
jgi:ribulose-phosphate 3-epimerase